MKQKNSIQKMRYEKELNGKINVRMKCMKMKEGDGKNEKKEKMN